jgi:DNA-binding YbaB/EbfC family protein
MKIPLSQEDKKMRPDLGKLMKQAQEMQRKMQEAQEEAEKRETTGEAGAGLVKITLNGKHEAKKTSIDNSVTSGMSAEDKEMLEDLITAAINDASKKIAANSTNDMSSLAGGFNLPGLDTLFKK